MSEAAEELKSELDSRELMAKVRYLEDALHSEQRNNEMAYLRGMVDVSHREMHFHKKCVSR